MKPEIKKSLFTIFKYGDIYQAIEKKEGATGSKNLKFFVDAYLFFLNFTFFQISFLTEKAINLIPSPVKKIHEATEKIRNVLGVNVDIIRKVPCFFDLFRKNKSIVRSSLAILYEEDSTNLQRYIENLKKIEAFCITYQIDQIQLYEEDVTYFISASSLDENHIYKIEHFGNLQSYFETDFERQYWRTFQLEQFSSLIHILESIHKSEDIIELHQDFHDIVIEKAIDQYQKNKNLELLFTIVTRRLESLFNSENTKKNREGKMYENVILKDDYVYVTTKNKFGKNISQETMTLYHYLDVINDKNLDTHIQTNDEGILKMVRFYLTLLKILKEKQKDHSKTVTFFDEIYEEYCSGSYKKNKYVFSHTRFQRMIIDIFRWLFFFISVLTGINLEPVMNSSEMSAYQSNLEYGGNSNSDFDPLYDNNPCFNIAKVGDVSESKDDIVLATIKPLSESVILPHYYARSFGFSQYCSDWSSYEYHTATTNRMYDHYDPNYQKPDFEISLKINKDRLSYFLQYVFFPVDIDCELTEVVIIDENKPINQILISNPTKQRTDVTEDERNSIFLMEQPVITYRYKINSVNPDLSSNIFVQDMKKSRYSYQLENRQAVLKGLKLAEDATLTEIYEAIRSKKYSLSPWKDAGIHVRYMAEHEYLEAMASLDSLNCNMAASLVVESNEELYYVTGYYDSDGQITKNDAHAWAMDKNGTLIDATPGKKIEDAIKDNVAESIAVAPTIPSKETISDIVKECIDWAIEKHIPFYMALVIASEIICKKLGKKINFRMEVKQIGKQLGQENSAEAYAKIKETWYGGMNIPHEEEIPDFVEMIDREFRSFSKEELQALKKELKNSGLEDKKVLKTAINIVDSIPFVRKNKEYIKKFYSQK